MPVYQTKFSAPPGHIFSSIFLNLHTINKASRLRGERLSFAVPPLLVRCRTIFSRYGRIAGDTLDCDNAIPASKPTRAQPFRFAAPGSIQSPLRRQLSPCLTLCGHRCRNYYSRSQPLQYSIANIINKMRLDCQQMPPHSLVIAVSRSCELKARQAAWRSCVWSVVAVDCRVAFGSSQHTI